MPASAHSHQSAALTASLHLTQVALLLFLATPGLALPPALVPPPRAQLELLQRVKTAILQPDSHF